MDRRKKLELKQLLTVGDSPIPSASQLWFNIANLAVTCVYVYIGTKVGLSLGVDVNDAQMLDSFTWFTVAYSGIVTSNKFANTLAYLKLGKKDDDTTKPIQ